MGCSPDAAALRTMVTKKGLRQTIAARLACSTADVFLTRDFKDLSSLDQIARAMRALVDDRILLRLGKGVYAKARISSISGRVVLANPGGFQIIAQEALTRLGIEWEPTAAQKAFAAGKTTQIPANPVHWGDHHNLRRNVRDACLVNLASRPRI